MNPEAAAALIERAAALLRDWPRRPRGIKVGPGRLALALEGVRAPALQAAAADHGLAVFDGPDGMVRIVSLAPPTANDGAAAHALVSERHRANSCRYCALQEPQPAALSKLPGDTRTGFVHPQCAAAWAIWSAAADRYAASRPKPDPSGGRAGLVDVVAGVAEELLGTRRGWHGQPDALFKPERAGPDAGAWISDHGLFENLLLHDTEIRRDLQRCGFATWRGVDGRARLVRSTAPASAAEAARILERGLRTGRSCSCACCGLDENGTGEEVERTGDGVYLHPRCVLSWQQCRRMARSAPVTSSPAPNRPQAA